MDRDALVAALAAQLPSGLTEDLVREFLSLRQDLASATLGGSAPGKFVETCVQVLQHLETGRFDARPNVDKYLREVESRSSPLHDGLRICAARVARSMYSLRSKRSISHKGEVDPNIYDLRLLHAEAQWILAELIRTITTMPMEEAGRLIEQVQAPVGGLIEDLGGKKLVLADLPARDEVLLLLHSRYPDSCSVADLIAWADRRDASTVRKNAKELWKRRLVEGDARAGYKLTAKGLRAAIDVFDSVNR